MFAPSYPCFAVPPVVPDPTCVLAAPFTHYTGSDNSLDGVMFEIRNIQSTAIRINSFDQVMNADGTSTMEVYTLSGSCDGLMVTESAWTLVGSGSFTHTALNVLPLPIPIAVTIQPNAVQSFYITNTNSNGANVAYKNGNAQYGAVYASNSDLEVIARGGVVYRFSSPAGVMGGAGRLWQGAVNYCVFDGPWRLHQYVPATGKLPIHANGTVANNTVASNKNCCPDECPPAGCPDKCSVC